MIMSILNIFWGNPNYLSTKMIIMRRIGRHEVVSNANQDVIKGYNTMHVG